MGRPGHRSSSLATQLLVTSLGLVLLATLVMSLLTVVVARSELSGEAASRRESEVTAIAVALSGLYRQDGKFTSENLIGPAALAADAHGSLLVTSPDGQVLAAPTDELVRRATQESGIIAIDPDVAQVISRPVIAGDRVVAYVTVSYPTGVSSEPEERVREALAEITATAAAASLAMALTIGLVLARRVTIPLRHLTESTKAFADGDRSVRVGRRRGGFEEVNDVSAAFDTLADALDNEDRVRRAMVEDLAHELRTPIAIVQAQTEAMLDGIVVVDDAALESLHDEVLRLRRLVGDLETLAAAEATSFDLSLDVTDVNEIVADVVESLMHSANERQLQVAEPERVEALARVDAGRVHQVVANLVSNAIKYTPEGGHIAVACTAGMSGERSVVRVIVDDSGPGIAAEDRHRVFDRFVRLDPAMSSGSGIGLPVVARLVAAHEGAVKVGTSPLGGARFVVEFSA